MVDLIQQKIKDNFAENLVAKDYLPFIDAFWKDLPELFRFMMSFIHDIFRSGKFRGSKLLEIGSGATVHNIANASAYFTNITMSDYVLDNVENLKQWLLGDSNLLQFLEVPARLEGYDNSNLDVGISILESRIRKNVKSVIRCDLLTDNILMDTSCNPDTSPPYDVVISSLCLEVAPKDFKGYISILKRINNLLRPGGGLVVCGFLQGSKWNIGNKEFHHIQFGENELIEALRKAGFGSINLKTCGKEGLKEINFNYDKLYCVSAEKLLRKENIGVKMED